VASEISKREAALYCQSIAAQRGIVRHGKVRLSPQCPAYLLDEKTEWVVMKLQLCFTRPSGKYNDGDLAPNLIEVRLAHLDEDGEKAMCATMLLDFLVRVKS